MAVPSVMADLSVTAATNSPAGTESPTAGDDFLRAIQAIVRTTNAKGSDIASATTTDIGAATAEFVDVTGTTTITGLGTIGAGIRRTVRFTGALTLTYNATSLILPGSANITTANGDVAQFRSLGSGNWVCTSYTRRDGTAIGGAPFIDSTAIIKGSADATKLVRIEADGLTTGNTRVATMPDKDITLAGLADINGGAALGSKIQPITASKAANALTITLNPTSLDFRSATLGSGTVTTVTNAAAISVVVSSGSTLGTTSAVLNRLTVIAINNAGTMELAVGNFISGTMVDEVGIVSTTAEGGAGGADTANVFYSTTARSSVAYRIVGFVESTQATAGTWATDPSLIQGAGGVDTNLVTLGFSNSYESPLQTITAAGALTLAHGLGRRPKWVMCWLENVTNEQGYTTGQRTPAYLIADDSANVRGASIIADATNITVRFGTAAGTFLIINATTGARSAITNGNWKFVVEALA